MQLFFNVPASISQGILKYSEWNYIREGLLRNLQTVQNFYRTRVYAVKTNHILAQLITNIGVSHKLDIERFYQLVDARANSLGMTFKLTSAISKGALFNGIFYGHGCTEIIMNDSALFDPRDAVKNWKNLAPVKSIMHPKSDLGLLLPNGKITGFETGLAVISINIPMLAIQWRCFAEDQLYNDISEGQSLQGMQHFIHRYVLPNMLPSHLDYALFNRLSNILNGKPMGNNVRQHPFVLIDYTNRVDNVHSRIINDLASRVMEYQAILRMIPAVSLPSMLEVMTIPENAPTRQVLWAEILSRLQVISDIITLGGDKDINRNSITLNSFAREFVLFNQEAVLKSALPHDLYLDASYQMRDICELVSKKFIVNV
jgi:hypothetical protein